MGAGKIYRTGRALVTTVDAVKEEMRDVLERAYGEEGARKCANLLSALGICVGSCMGGRRHHEARVPAARVDTVKGETRDVLERVHGEERARKRPVLWRGRARGSAQTS